MWRIIESVDRKLQLTSYSQKKAHLHASVRVAEWPAAHAPTAHTMAHGLAREFERNTGLMKHGVAIFWSVLFHAAYEQPCRRVSRAVSSSALDIHTHRHFAFLHANVQNAAHQTQLKQKTIAVIIFNMSTYNRLPFWLVSHLYSVAQTCFHSPYVSFS